MREKTVEISKNEYKKILELAYKAAMLEEAVLSTARLDTFYGDELYFGGGIEVATIFKYAFPEDYERKLRELQDKEKAEDSKNDEDNKEGADDER